MPHGAPLTGREQSEFDAMVAELRQPRRAPRAVRHDPRRAFWSASGWPAWATGLLGLVLVAWGCGADSWMPLLLGTALTLSAPGWIDLPRVGLRGPRRPAA